MDSDRRHYWIELTGGTGLVLLFLLIWWFRRDRPVEIDLGSIPLEQDSHQLEAIGEEIQRIQNWSPWKAFGKSNEDWASALADLIRHEDYRSADRGTDFLQRWPLLQGEDGHEDAGLERNLHGELSTFNSIVALLSERLDARRLAYLRQQDKTRIVAELKDDYAIALAMRRDQDLKRLLTANETAKLLSRNKIPPYPADSGRLGAKDWIDGYLRAVDGQLRPHLDWYSRLCHLEPLVVAEGNLNSLLLTGRKSLLDWSDVHASGRAVGDFSITVAHRGGIAGGDKEPDATNDVEPAEYRSTGIKLLRLPISQATSEDSAIERRWPPQHAVVEKEVFDAWLRAGGLPRHFMVARASPRLTSKPQGVRVDITIQHEEIDPFEWNLELDLSFDSADLDQTLDAFVAQLGQAHEKLADALPQLKTWRSMPAEISPSDADRQRFRCRLRYPDSNAVEIDLTVTAQGKVVPTVSPSAVERQRLAQFVLRDKAALSALVHLISIDSMWLRPGTADLEGLLTIHGTAIDAAADRLGIPWSLAAESGAVRVDMTGDDLRYIRGLRLRSSQIPSVTADTPGDLAHQLTDYLREKYPRLDGDVEILEPSTGRELQFLRLTLSIDRWPDIALGPVPVEATTFAATVDKLLSPESVITAARRQWCSPDGQQSSGLQFELSGWSPVDAEAVVACRLPIKLESGEKTAAVHLLSWDHRQRRISDDWRIIGQDGNAIPQMTLDQWTSRSIEPKLAGLERALSKWLSDRLHLPVELSVERDAFGRDQWLRLDPFAVQLRATIALPWNMSAVDVGGGRILLDCDGLHLPDEIIIGQRTTFPTPNFAVSDPQVRINFADWGAGISCKITPPAPPSLNLFPVPISRYRLRADNPWLHVIFLEAELYGTAADWSIAGQSDIWVLERSRISTADLTYSGRDNALTGYLRAGQRYRGLPELSGRLAMGDGEPMRVHGSLHAAGVSLVGDLRLDKSTSETKWVMEGWSTVPVIGLVQMHAETDLRFKDTRFRARGQKLVHTGIESVPLDYDLYADRRRGYRLSVRWATAEGEAEYHHCGYSFGSFNEDQLLRELKRQIRDTRQTRETDEVNRRNVVSSGDLAKLPAAPERSAMQGGPEPLAKNLPLGFSGFSGSFYCKRTKGSLQFLSRDEDRLVLTIPLNRLPFSPDGKCRWAFASGDPWHLLVADPRTRRVWHLSGTAGAQRIDRRDKTAEFKELLAAIFDGEQVEKPVAAWTALRIYTGLASRGPVPRHPEAGYGGFLVSHRSSSTELGQVHQYCWARGAAGYAVTISEDILPVLEEDRESFFKALQRLRPTFGSMVVRVNSEDPTQIAVLQPVQRAGGLQLLLQSAERIQQTIDLETQRSPIGNIGSLNAVVELSDRNAVDLTEVDRIFIGEGGICLASEGGLWLGKSEWLLQRPLEDEAVRFVSSDAFCTWPNRETILHLRKDLRVSEKQRRNIWREYRWELAREIVRPWHELRSDTDWSANPLGLMLGLAGQTSVADAETGIENERSDADAATE